MADQGPDVVIPPDEPTDGGGSGEDERADAAEHDNATEPLATQRDVAALKRDLAELEARLTWRFAMLAQTGVMLAAVIGAAIAILRMLGS